MTIYVVGSLTDGEHDLLQADGWQLLVPESAIKGDNVWAIPLGASDLVAFLDNLQPPDFKGELERLILQGLDDDEILEHLDPDTAGADLVALVRKLMAPVSTHLVSCCFCHQETPEATAHVHGAMWVCDECWDEGLRTTS